MAYLTSPITKVRVLTNTILCFVRTRTKAVDDSNNGKVPYGMTCIVERLHRSKNILIFKVISLNFFSSFDLYK